MKEVYGIIYKIENLVNGKIYIGQTTRSFNERYCAKGEGIERVYGYLNYRKLHNEDFNTHLLNSIAKYGVKNFKVNEEFDMAYSFEELNEKEIYWISYYNSSDNRYGYNETTGGIKFKPSVSIKWNRLYKSLDPLICNETNEIFKNKKEAVSITNSYVYSKHNRNTFIVYKNTPLSLARNYNYYEFNKYTFSNLYYKNHIPIVCINTGLIYVSKLYAAKDIFNNTHKRSTISKAYSSSGYKSIRFNNKKYFFKDLKSYMCDIEIYGYSLPEKYMISTEALKEYMKMNGNIIKNKILMSELLKVKINKVDEMLNIYVDYHKNGHNYIIDKILDIPDINRIK